MPSKPTASHAAMAAATSSGVPIVTPLNDLAASPGTARFPPQRRQQPSDGYECVGSTSLAESSCDAM